MNMNKFKLRALCLALGLSASLSVLAAGVAHIAPPSAPVQVTNDGASGSIELSNVSEPDTPAPLAAEPVADTAAVAPASDAVPTEATTGEAAAAETTTAEATDAEPPKDPRELHREKVMLMPQEMPAGTSASSRRYKKVDLATYRATMLGTQAQNPTSPSAGAATAR